MNVAPTPAKAHQLTAELLPSLEMIYPALLKETALEQFHEAIKAARLAIERPANAANCRDIEQQLATMVNLLLDSPRIHEKPREQIQVILDCFEIAGGACSATAVLSTLP